MALAVAIGPAVFCHCVLQIRQVSLWVHAQAAPLLIAMMCRHRRLVWEDHNVPRPADVSRLPWPDLPPSLEELDLLSGAGPP